MTTDPTLDSTTPSLTLPASTFAKLAPREFLSAHLVHQTRPSHRSPLQCRQPTFQTSSLTHAHGSTVVRLGDTAAVCGVRGEILSARNTALPQSLKEGVSTGMRDAAIISELGLLVPNIELSTGCNPAHMPGSAPGTLAQSLAHRLLALLKITDLVPLAALEIRAPLKRASDGNEVMAYWTLYIDILVISLDGCAFDAAWAAVLSSLQTALLPNAWWDADVDEMRCDPRKENGRNLSLRGLPVALSYGVFQTKAPGGQAYANGKSWVLADPDDLEESCCDGFVTIVVDEGGKKIIRIEAGGAIGGVGIKGMHGLVRRAAERWTEWKSVLKIQESLQKIG